jgi:PST family polysaccharide transporter
MRRIAGLARLAARDQVARGVSWLGAGEAVVRISRIATTVIVAHHLGAVELGIAALAITAFEIVRAFAASGIGQTVVRAAEHELAATLAAATRAARFVCLSLAVVQLLVGFALAWWTGRAELAALAGCLAGVFLLMPLGLPQCWLVMRANRMATVARVSTAQLVADNLLTAVLAIAGFGAWAVVLPKLATVPVWVAGMRHAVKSIPPLPPAKDAAIGMRAVWRFAAPVLGSELLAAARLNADRLIVGAALGVEALGLYWFSVNAGLGLGVALAAALASSAYPVLAAVAHDPAEMLRRFDRAMLVTALPIALLVAVQAALAPFYVPLVFGQHWVHAVPLVVLLCVSGVTRPFADAGAQLLRAAGLPGRELVAALVVTIAQIGTFALAITGGLATAIAVSAAITSLLNASFALWARAVVRREIAVRTASQATRRETAMGSLAQAR